MSQFIYLLNAMEDAAQAADPSTKGYGLKRRAVLEYVEKLEAVRGEAEGPSAISNAGESHTAAELADMMERAAAGVSFVELSGQPLADAIRFLREAPYLSMLKMARDKIKFEANSPGGFAAAIDAVIEDARSRSEGNK